MSNSESAKLRALCAKNVLACQRALRAHVPCVLTCERAILSNVYSYIIQICKLYLGLKRGNIGETLVNYWELLVF